VSFLLDTNGVSEWGQPLPEPGPGQLAGYRDEDRVYLSVVTLAELRHGLDAWPTAAPGTPGGVAESGASGSFRESRVLAVRRADRPCVGRLVAQRGRWSTVSLWTGSLPHRQTHELTLVTRNVRTSPPQGWVSSTRGRADGDGLAQSIISAAVRRGGIGSQSGRLFSSYRTS